MKVATQTAADCEALLGPRGHVRITKDNRGTARKWLSAHDFPAIFSGGLSYKELELAYNDVSGTQIETLRRKLAGAIADADIDDEHGLAPVKHDAPAPAAMPQAVQHGPAIDGDAAKALAVLTELFAKQKQAPGLDFDAVRQIVRDEVQGLKPRPLEVKINGAAGVVIDERCHPVFDRVLKLVANGANVLLVGPAGCGKSHLCEQISRALKANYGAIHGTAGASESALTGWLLPSDGGKFEYVPARFVELYEQGESLFCFDELDAFDPNMLLVVNGATSNGHIHIAHRREKPSTPRGKNVRLMATANTFGTGANPMYSGRAALDGATLDRWIPVTVDYDKALETDIGNAAGLSASEMAEIWSLRDKVRNSQLRRTISTRAFQKAGIMKAAGDNWPRVMATLVEGWSKDEKAKAGVA